MSRGLLGSLASALQQESILVSFFVKLEFDSGVQRYHSGIGDVTLNSEVYKGVGELGKIDAISEDSDLAMKGIKIQLSGIDTTKVDLTISESIRGRLATLYAGVVDPETMTCSDYVEMFIGYMDSVQYVRSSEKGSMVLSVESIMTQFDLPAIRRATNEDHQDRYPGDTFYEHTGNSANSTIVWGPSTLPGIPAPRPGPQELR